jgi:hypothetical protein
MTVTPQGISVQTVYRWYREGTLVVNRQYQRKLVWTIAEKQGLIDSILKGYPIPLFLLAERESSGKVVYEIIDGLQRLNAVLGFIENTFLVNDKCFDINEFSRARQLAEDNIFTIFPQEIQRMEANQCANILDYQLAVTIFPGEDNTKTTDVFGRINSSGKHLSDQERRQAGVLSQFASTVRGLAEEIRGDVSREILLLSEMPEISIETSVNTHGYKLKAEEVFWCYQGILRTSHLRDSEDEQVIADIVASIVLDEPAAASGAFLDKLYDENSEESAEVNRKLSAYPPESLCEQVKTVFSTIRKTIESFNTERFYFRNIVYPRPTSNAQKQAFFAVFMAFHELIYKEGKLPANEDAIFPALTNLSDRIKVGQKHVKAKDRRDNIRVTKGLISDFFANGDVASIQHGPGMIFDFENSIRRSRTETSRYEFKQGLLNLDSRRDINAPLIDRLMETMVAIANVGPDSDGYLYLGIADSDADANRIASLDGIQPFALEAVKVVGVEREAKIIGKPLDKYIKILEDKISSSGMTDPLRTQILSNLDSINYKGFSLIRVRVPKQRELSFIKDDCYIRQGTSTVKATGPQVAASMKAFG